MSFGELLDIGWQALPTLLYLFWGLATGAAVLSLCPITSLDGFRNAVQLSACRGKLWESRPLAALGPLSNWTVPQKWFAYFYFIGLLMATLMISLVSNFQIQNKVWSIVTLALLEFHFGRRFLETIHLLRYPNGASMHGIAYLFGLAYYAVLPLTCIPIEAYGVPLRKLIHWSFRFQRIPANEHINFLVYTMGVAIFIGGMVLQFHSHWILAVLSRTSGKQAHSNSEVKPHSTPYRIPRGGAFELVSCPHYLGEIVIYLGLTLQLDMHTPLHLLPLCWVVANLILGAKLTHSWYQQKFEDYPKHRAALFPFVY